MNFLLSTLSPQHVLSSGHKWEGAGATFDLFFTAPDIPRENPNVNGVTSSADDNLWRSKIRATGTLLTLAQNPYMLTMMTDIYRDSGTLPDNRGELFTQFVAELIQREKRTNERMAGRESALTAALAKLAYVMQTRRSPLARYSGRGAGGIGVKLRKNKHQNPLIPALNP